MESLESGSAPPSGSTTALADADIVKRVQAGETALFEVLMRRHNQRVYRVARAVMKDELEVEDVMQQAYINAFTHLHQFEERSRFSTWLTRITLNEAFGRRRKLKLDETRSVQSGLTVDRGDSMDRLISPQADPERQAYAGELSVVLEQAVDSLPEAYRTVFMLRDIEGLSTTETAEGLGLGDEAVKTRLHRARGMIRRAVTERLGEVTAGAFQFHAVRCDRVVEAVFSTIKRYRPQV